MSLAVVILAAGQGTRMLSEKQKILHEVGGKPMVRHVFDAVSQVADQPPVLVVGPEEDGVQDLLGAGARYVVQPEQQGTGDATLMTRELLLDQAEQVLVTYGDMPLVRARTLRHMADRQKASGAAVVMLTVMGDSTSTFGRVVRDYSGAEVLEIVEVAEARLRPDGDEILAIPELNAGVYCFDSAWLWARIDDLPLREARNGREYYLTDMVGLAVDEGRMVEAVIVEDEEECLGAGTREEMVQVEKAFRRRAARRWLARGVTLLDPEATYIDQQVIIGQDTIIWPNTYLQGDTIIGQGAVLGPNTIVRDARIGDGCHIEQSVIEGVSVPEGKRLTPFSHIRP